MLKLSMASSAATIPSRVGRAPCRRTASTGVKDVTVSLPRLVGGTGVAETFPLPLAGDELAQLRASAAVIRAALDELDASQ